MPAAATQNTQQLITPDEAYDVLVAEIRAPVFFEKLARVYGITPQTEQQARDLLQMGYQLRNVHEVESNQKAAAAGDAVSMAKRHLDATLAEYGYPQPQSQYNPHVKQAANRAASNPLLREAAIVFQNYLAQQA